MKYITYLLLCLSLTACDKFEVNPYAVRLDEDERNLTAKQLLKLKTAELAQPSKPEVTIAFISDSQRAIDEFEEGIHHINQNDEIDMVFHGGDITDYSLAIEYKKMAKLLNKLKAPYFTAFGNHDALATGVSAYQAMFGDLDYSFKVWGHKFIFFNGNHLEFKIQVGDAPKFSFLESELADNGTDFQNIFMVSHIGPIHGEFGADNSEKYHQLMLNNPKVKLSLHGHGHSHQFGELYGNGFDYLQVDNAEDKNYLLIKIQQDGTYTLERIFY